MLRIQYTKPQVASPARGSFALFRILSEVTLARHTARKKLALSLNSGLRRRTQVKPAAEQGPGLAGHGGPARLERVPE